jgi:hypothetical protein
MPNQNMVRPIWANVPPPISEEQKRSDAEYAHSKFNRCTEFAGYECDKCKANRPTRQAARATFVKVFGGDLGYEEFRDHEQDYDGFLEQKVVERDYDVKDIR